MSFELQLCRGKVGDWGHLLHATRVFCISFPNCEKLVLGLLHVKWPVIPTDVHKINKHKAKWRCEAWSPSEWDGSLFGFSCKAALLCSRRTGSTCAIFKAWTVSYSPQNGFSKKKRLWELTDVLKAFISSIAENSLLLLCLRNGLYDQNYWNISAMLAPVLQKYER